MKNLFRIDVLHPAGVAAVACAALLTLAGCASTPPHSDAHMAVAQAAVEHANTPGTSQDAPMELQLATSKLVAARTALADKNYERADQLAEEVQIDAKVAELHAQSARSRRAAQESQAAAAALRDEISRNTTR
ncbi:MAG: DUF4398 domain-containing protein [Rhodoferax sp.]|jgi:hypothetical protein|uniref:DUF4398 domain-containing protein n=1 Tax=Candidatus Aalborgicola defluviihabitans TaxID=3386187 RepID=UPI00390BACD9|nr:DUF4398 domain-containing protein [Burkholderiales bacterium]